MGAQLILKIFLAVRARRITIIGRALAIYSAIIAIFISDINRMIGRVKEHIFNEAERVGQRLDNWLIRQIKGVPKSRIYRALRKGEVRVNGKRVKAEYKLCLNDKIRIPPLRAADKPEQPRLSKRWQSLAAHIIFEDKGLIILNKPAGLPVHGGTGQQAGIIEATRELRPKEKFLELAHRLDRPTSGCLLIAKKRSYLVSIQQQLIDRTFKKTYLMVVKGKWSKRKTRVNAPLKKNTLRSGERMVRVDPEGKEAVTEFEVLRATEKATLLAAYPKTGRTHQLRVHAASEGHPIIGDQKYGDGVKADRLYLHAAAVSFKLPDGTPVSLCAVLPEGFDSILRDQ